MSRNHFGSPATEVINRQMPKFLKLALLTYIYFNLNELQSVFQTESIAFFVHPPGKKKEMLLPKRA